MSLPKYPKYKDSGVEWLGEVPEGWEVSKVGRHVILDVGFAFQSDQFSEFGVKLLRGDNVTEGKTRWGEKTRYWPYDKTVPDRYLLNEGDIVISMDGSKVGKNYSLISKEDLPAYLVQRVARLKTKEDLLNSFLLSLIGWDLFKEYVNIIKTDPAIPHITAKNIQDFFIPLPPLPEQAAIAAFLDRETGKIDALVSEQEKLIALLKEKRQALISHAVTKGLDPKAKMKDSGVEWLGEVPHGWEVKPLKYLGEAITGLTYSPENIVDESDGILVLRSSNVQAGKISLHDNVFVKTDLPEKLLTQRGDILICSRNGSRALIGKNAKIEEPYENLTWGAFMTMFRSPYHQYLFFVFNSPIFESQSSLFLTSTINQLTIGNLYSLIIPVPPLPEQTAIATFLDRETGKIDALMQEADRGIELLKERRSALISAAVTGKIDVRGLATA